VAAACRVPYRIHGEHGRDVFDVDGTRTKFNVVRRLIHPLVHDYIAVSADLASWLTTVVHIPEPRVHCIPNGVDSRRFSRIGGKGTPEGFPLGDRFVIGTVGRMAAIKNQTLLVDAYIHLVSRRPDLRDHLGLVLVGDGPLKLACEQKLAAASLMRGAWLPGERGDIPEVMRTLDVFVLPSRAEGMSNTILEAMASGVPVIATDVGGNRELVRECVTGLIVPADDVAALAGALEDYVDNSTMARQHGDAGRRIVEQSFSLDRMVDSYLHVYDRLLQRGTRGRAAEGSSACH
jgi:sugar transferase (PEP-CTERM/EpsH1 system associated)